MFKCTSVSVVVYTFTYVMYVDMFYMIMICICDQIYICLSIRTSYTHTQYLNTHST